MKIDLTQSPDRDIFRKKKSYIIWFSFFMLLVLVSVAIGFYAVYSSSENSSDLADYALGILVAASVGITIFGNRLQAYKALFPPQKEKLQTLRSNYPVIETYCTKVEAMQRRFIRAEYEACAEYAETQETVGKSSEPVVYGPIEDPEKKSR